MCEEYKFISTIVENKGVNELERLKAIAIKSD